MKTVHVSSTMLKRLATLEFVRAVRRSTQLWPTVLDGDAWSALATPMQAALYADTQDDATSAPTAPSTEAKAIKRLSLR